MKAMILAAGRGKRMMPLTADCPKPLLEVQGKPLIVHTIERLKAAGFLELVINTAYLGEKIEQALGDGSRYGVQIKYSREKEGLETGGGIKQALSLLTNGKDKSNEPFLLINSDVWTDFDLRLLKKQNSLNKSASEKKALAHLVLVDNPEHNPQGDFFLKEDFSEGTVCLKDNDSQEKTLTYSGIAIINPKLLDYSPSEKKFALLPLLQEAITRQQITGEYYPGLWMDVGTPERLQAINAATNSR